MKEIRARAAALGIAGAEEMGKVSLIRAIQVKEGHTACFGTD